MKLNEIKLNRLTKGVQDYHKTLDVIAKMDLDPDRVDDWFKEHGTDQREHKSTGFMLASFIAHVVFHLKNTVVQINELGFLSEIYRYHLVTNFSDLEVSLADAYILLDTFFDEVFEDQLHYEITENRPVSKFVKDYRNTLDCLFRIIGYLDNFNKFIVAELDGLLDNGDSKEELLARYICETVFDVSYKDGKLAKLYIENFMNGYAKNDEIVMNFMYDHHWCERGKKPDPFDRSTGIRLLKVLGTFLSETKRRKEKEKERMNNKNREIKTHMYRGALSEESLENKISPDCNHKCPCNKNNRPVQAMNVDQLITILMHADKSAPVPPEVEAWAKIIEHEEEEFTPFMQVREKISAFTTRELDPVKIKDVNTKDKQIDRLAQEICNIVFEIHPPTAKECLRYVTYVYRNVRNLLSDNIDQLTPWEYCPEFWTSCIVDRGWGHIGNDEKVHLNDLGNDIYDLLEAFDLFIHASKVITNK